MNGENKIDYIEMPAKEPAVAWAFFEGLFGWKFDDYGPDYNAFHDGRMAGGFYRSDRTASVDNGSVLVVFYLHTTVVDRGGYGRPGRDRRLTQSWSATD